MNYLAFAIVFFALSIIEGATIAVLLFLLDRTTFKLTHLQERFEALDWGRDDD